MNKLLNLDIASIFSKDSSGRALMGVARAEELEKFPESPGLYAWYPGMSTHIPANLTDLMDGFYSRYAENELVYRRVAKTIDSGIQVTIDRVRNTPPENYKHKLDELPISLSQDESLLKQILKLLMASSLFSETFYIGVAAREDGGIRSRIKEHLRTRVIVEKLRSLGNKNKINLEDSIIVTINLSALKGSTGDYIKYPDQVFLAELLEAVFIRNNTPALNRKQGV